MNCKHNRTSLVGKGVERCDNCRAERSVKVKLNKSGRLAIRVLSPWTLPRREKL